MKVKKTWKQVDGVLLLDKPIGLTSNDALQKARRLFSAAKGGHTGTLDPLATGLLPLCFGEATKFSADLLDADKTYEAVLKLGVTTDSGDAEGKVTATATVNTGKAAILEVLPQFTGTNAVATLGGAQRTLADDRGHQPINFIEAQAHDAFGQILHGLGQPHGSAVAALFQ